MEALHKREKKKESTGARSKKLMASKVGRHLINPRFLAEMQKLWDEDDQGESKEGN